jgi:spore coat protein CotF
MDEELTVTEALDRAGALLDELRAADLLCTEDELREVMRALVESAHPQVREWLSKALLEAEVFGDAAFSPDEQGH